MLYPFLFYDLNLSCFYNLQSYVKSRPGLQGRTLCDRVIRACNHHLGAGSPDFDHVSQLVQLVELSLSGYDISTALVAQSSPLYMEKIVFHIVKKLSSLEAHSLCSHVAGLLYSRLTPVQQVCITSFLTDFMYMCSIGMNDIYLTDQLLADNGKFV